MRRSGKVELAPGGGALREKLKASGLGAPRGWAGGSAAAAPASGRSGLRSARRRQGLESHRRAGEPAGPSRGGLCARFASPLPSEGFGEPRGLVT